MHILLSHSISIMDRQRGDGEAFSSPLEDQVGERESSISVPLMCNRAILIERQSQAEVFYEPKSVEPSKMPLLFAANICKLFYKGK